MGLKIQMVVDSKNPHELADWWAETLTHHGKLVWRTGQAIRPVEELEAKAPAHRVLFQAVPEGKTVKNRVHWDVRLDGRDKEEVRKQLEARGATFLWTANEGPHEWHTMADPEGNEFCIS